ncbi:MAG: hypothetical protein JWR44_1686 [Hymenobacter sp.]|nr:hypothetical protein [Hymenobacter sp.]
MKTTVLTLALVAASFAAFAQAQPATVAPSASAAPADAYSAMLGATIAEQNAAGPAALPAIIAKLERAASARPADWLPRYYQARAYIKIGFATQGEEQQDKVFDQAQAALDQAKKGKDANQAEILILQAYLYQGRLMVSPMSRGMEYSGRVAEALEMARKLEPQNPRVYLLQANDLYFRPAEFGGGAAQAKPLYEKAKALFATYKPATALSPNWGESNAKARLDEIAGATAATK